MRRDNLGASGIDIKDLELKQEGIACGIPSTALCIPNYDQQIRAFVE